MPVFKKEGGSELRKRYEQKQRATIGLVDRRGQNEVCLCIIQVTDLHRYNIQALLIDRYDEVPEILAELNRRSHLRDVFISGSAADFAPLGRGKFHDLCRALGFELIKKGFNIISGFGAGVGDLVTVGAMQFAF